MTFIVDLLIVSIWIIACIMIGVLLASFFDK